MYSNLRSWLLYNLLNPPPTPKKQKYRSFRKLTMISEGKKFRVTLNPIFSFIICLDSAWELEIF